MSTSEDLKPSLGGAGFLSRARKRDASADLIVAATPAQVWNLVSDVERVADWWPRALRGAVLDGEGAGRTQMVRLDWGRAEGAVKQKVTVWEPSRRYGWRVLSEKAGEKTLTPIADTNVVVQMQPSVTDEGAPATQVMIEGTFEAVSARGAIAIRQVVRLAKSTYKQALRNLDDALKPR